MVKEDDHLEETSNASELVDRDNMPIIVTAIVIVTWHRFLELDLMLLVKLYCNSSAAASTVPLILLPL